VVGGEGATSAAICLKYFTRQDEWQTFEKSPAPLGSRPSAAYLDTQFYSLGGDVVHSVVDTSQSYQAIYTILVPIVQ
jgi:hypothetical protein